MWAEGDAREDGDAWNPWDHSGLRARTLPCDGTLPPPSPPPFPRSLPACRDARPNAEVRTDEERLIPPSHSSRIRPGTSGMPRYLRIRTGRITAVRQLRAFNGVFAGMDATLLLDRSGALALGRSRAALSDGGLVHGDAIDRAPPRAVDDPRRRRSHAPNAPPRIPASGRSASRIPSPSTSPRRSSEGRTPKPTSATQTPSVSDARTVTGSVMRSPHRQDRPARPRAAPATAAPECREVRRRGPRTPMALRRPRGRPRPGMARPPRGSGRERPMPMASPRRRPQRSGATRADGPRRHGPRPLTFRAPSPEGHSGLTQTMLRRAAPARRSPCIGVAIASAKRGPYTTAPTTAIRKTARRSPIATPSQRRDERGGRGGRADLEREAHVNRAARLPILAR